MSKMSIFFTLCVASVFSNMNKVGKNTILSNVHSTSCSWVYAIPVIYFKSGLSHGFIPVHIQFRYVASEVYS